MAKRAETLPLTKREFVKYLQDEDFRREIRKKLTPEQRALLPSRNPAGLVPTLAELAGMPTARWSIVECPSISGTCNWFSLGCKCGFTLKT